ncbi:MAG: hypothetical protein AAFP28_09150 [Pseudomonadota bacterium]
MTTSDIEAEKADQANKVALRSLWIIDTAMRRRARAKKEALAAWALFYAVLAAIPIAISLWLLTDAPQGRLGPIGAALLEDLRPPVQDHGRDTSQRFVEILTERATRDYKSFTGSLGFASTTIIVGLLLVYALFAQLRLMLRYVRRIAPSSQEALTWAPSMAAGFSLIAAAATMLLLSGLFDIPGPLVMAMPAWWPFLAIVGVVLTAVLSAVTLQGTRLIAWNYMQVEWAEALDEELKRAKNLGLGADAALNAALKEHPRPIKKDIAWKTDLANGSLTIPEKGKERQKGITTLADTSTVDLPESAPHNWRVDDPIVSTTMTPKACLAMVNGLCRVYAIVLVAIILFAGFWLKSMTIDSAVSEVPAYEEAVRASVNAWLAATGLAASLVLAIAYVGSVLRLIPFVAAEDALKPEPERSKRTQTHVVGGLWGDQFVRLVLSEGQDDDSPKTPDPFKEHEARLGMSRKKFRIIRRAGRIGGAFHHLTSTSLSGHVTSLLNLVLPASASAIVTLFS